MTTTLGQARRAGRRPFLRGLGALVVTAALVPGIGAAQAQEDWAAVEAAAQTEGSLVLYSPATDLADALIAGFNKTYPNIKVDTVTGSPGQLTSRVVTEAQASAPTADVLIVPRGNQKALLDNNVIVPSPVPNDATMSPNNIDASGNSHPIYVNPIMILYNTNVVKPEDLPKDVTGLTDPKWKGKIAFDRPANAATAASFLSSPRKAWGDEKWRAWLDGLKANEVFITSDGTSAYQAALRGEVSIAIQSANQIATQAEGAPMAAAGYDNIVDFVQSIWLTKGAAHPNAAKLFINWVISEEGQTVMAGSGRAPALRSVASPLSKVMPAEITSAPSDSLDDFYANPDSYLGVFAEVWPN